MGVETEYAFRALGRHGRRVGQERLVERLVCLAAETMPSLPEAAGTGIFLATGGRLYVDAGLHPEYATPECPSPAVAVRYVKGGHRILERLAGALVEADDLVEEASVFAGNQDYASGNTWASHENYLHRSDPEALFENLVPHLVTRVVYTGAGGFNPTGPGIEFTLSAREPHMRRVRSENSTSARGIYHTKEEPHCGGGYGRLHVLVGDSLASELAGCLRLGTTALIVALTEEDRAPGLDLGLRSPLTALHLIARDPSCRARFFRRDGALTTALEIQFQYLERVEAVLGEPFLPDWAEETCRLWRETLEALEESPRLLARSLDWAIKWEIFGERARRRGFDPGAIRLWNGILRRARLSGEKILELHRGPPLGELPSPMAAAWRRVRELDPLLQEAGRDWEELEELLKLRRELLELDTRFAQLGTGLFAELDRRPGVLKHRVREVADVELAVTHPPLEGRARLRGEVIRRTSPAGGRYLCDWSRIVNPRERSVLDLSDPFETRESWRPLQVRPSEDPPEVLRSAEERPPTAAERRLEEAVARLEGSEEGLPPEQARRHLAALRRYLLGRSLGREAPEAEPAQEREEAGRAADETGLG
jgi:proteasome accessory factor A